MEDFEIEEALNQLRENLLEIDDQGLEELAGGEDNY